MLIAAKAVTTGTRNLLIVSGAILLLSAVVPATVYADGGITLSPTQKELVLSSGLLEAHNTITVTNRSGRELSASVRAVDFSDLNASGGAPFGELGKSVSKYGLANWMTLPTSKNIILRNGQPTNIPVIISNRSDLAPGGHYGAVVVTTGEISAAKDNNIGLRQELVSLIFVKKLGGEQYGLKLDSLTAGGNQQLPTSATLKFSSTGNVHVVPRGYVTVTDPRNKVVAKGIINPESTLVLPETSKNFTSQLQQVAGSGYPGRYKLTAYYRYDGREDFISSSISTTRLVTPASLAAISVLTVVILLLIALRFKRFVPFLGRR